MGDVLNRGSKDRPHWYCRYVDVDGRRKQRATRQRTKGDALAFLAEVEARVRRGMIGVPELTEEQIEQKSVTLAKLAARFLGDEEEELEVPGYRSPGIKNLSAYRSNARCALAPLLEALGHRAAASITTADIERVRDVRTAVRAGNTVKNMLTATGKLYAWALRAGLLDCKNPVVGVERPRGAKALEFLAAAEVGTLLAVAEDLARPGVASWEATMLWPMVATAAFCGLRKGELFGLRWCDVDTDALRVSVERSYRLAPKGGKARHLPMPAEFARVLRVWRERCPKTDDGLVFPTIGDGERGRWHMGEQQDMVRLPGLLASAGLRTLKRPWHTLRHTFASNMVMSGAGLYDVQRLLGHSTPVMTQRYAHLAPDHLAATVARLRYDAPPAGTVIDFAEEQRQRAAASGMDH